MSESVLVRATNPRIDVSKCVLRSICMDSNVVWNMEFGIFRKI